MAHKEQKVFCSSIRSQFPQYFQSVMALDIGSLDINGNNQYLFDCDSTYIGLDIGVGKNVDFVLPAHKLELPNGSFDTIVSTECLEHDQYWQSTLKNAVRLLCPGGMLLITCATTGRPEHGTRRTTPSDAPLLQGMDDGWSDYYQNLTQKDFESTFNLEDIFEIYEFSVNEHTHDLYFFGIKRGQFLARTDRSINLDSHPKNRAIASLNQRITERDDQLVKLKKVVVEQDDQLDKLNQILVDSEGEIVKLKQMTIDMEARYQKLITTRSWRLTKPLRLLARLTRGEIGTFISPQYKEKILSRARLLCRAANYLIRGDIKVFVDRFRANRRDLYSPTLESAKFSSGEKSFCVLTPPHTLYIAHLIKERLTLHGCIVNIMTKAPKSFDCDFYFVLCPQVFSTLPQAEKRIIFQLEQSVSSRWFTPEYLKVLNSSFAMLEYALSNLEFLKEKGIAFPHVHYLPVGGSTTYGQEIVSKEDKVYDVLFYGDSNSSSRRRKMLDELKQHFKVHIVNELFGEKLQEVIKQSRVVINIHYYENALLEVPRIQECLSLGVPVVSEATQDQDDYPELAGAVRFFEMGSTSEMISSVRSALDNPASLGEVRQSCQLSNERFGFMFDRFMMAIGFLPSTHIQEIKAPIPTNADLIALSLPETFERRKLFEQVRPKACIIFDGIRRHPGWVGCGLSYQALARYAVDTGKSSLTVMEDDVELPQDFEEKMSIIKEYLANRDGEWDVFAGVIACLHPDVSVLAVDIYKNTTFVTINKMTSTVCNIYSKRFMQTLLSWNPENLDAETNTIDRFIEKQSELRVVVALPFIVGHREDSYSTLWGFQNTQYRDLILNSQSTLQAKVRDFCDTEENQMQLKPLIQN